MIWDAFLRICSQIYPEKYAPRLRGFPGVYSGIASVRKDYLSPAPQAEPQAVGVVSGLSPAPQAEPQAVGASAGLSPAPQAVPAAAVCSDFFVHPNKFESAMIFYLRLSAEQCLVTGLLYNKFQLEKSTHKSITQAQKDNYGYKKVTCCRE